MPEGQGQRDRWRRYWDKAARSYDRQMAFFDRVLFGGSREWVCAQATGDTLEVGIGTGLNLSRYPAGVTLTGVDISPAMLTIAAGRARQLGRTVHLHQADAAALPFPAATFDTVVCTFALCAIPGHHQAIREMKRVLRPGGRLLLADHVAASARSVRAIQRLLETVTVPLQGEHFPAPPSRPGTRRRIHRRTPGTLQGRNRRTARGTQTRGQPARHIRAASVKQHCQHRRNVNDHPPTTPAPSDPLRCC